jgi:hypothetical protein
LRVNATPLDSRHSTVEYILSEHVIDFDAYSRYLDIIRDRLPPHVAAFAADARHFSLDAPETLHDAWLIELAVREPATGERQQHRATEIEVRLLGPFHDRVHVLQYTGVRRYEVAGGSVAGGHGDLYTHEVRLASDGVGLIHEYLFVASAGCTESRLLIECADFTHAMLPRSQIAS